ncbi:MAG: hypothetical protein AUJ96_06145 [Armatimonadetes bacterium CG2_30_66_41]|nr:MAG: hypothetical protein AUJ96_06145 [Armatimonadetes bacterium CG2_30_66_41]
MVRLWWVHRPVRSAEAAPGEEGPVVVASQEVDWVLGDPVVYVLLERSHVDDRSVVLPVLRLAALGVDLLVGARAL